MIEMKTLDNNTRSMYATVVQYLTAELPPRPLMKSRRARSSKGCILCCGKPSCWPRALIKVWQELNRALQLLDLLCAPPRYRITMSWQAYIDEQLMVDLPQGGKLTHAAIIGDDGSIWAQSSEFPPVTPGQVHPIVAAIGDDEQVRTMGGRGLVFGESKFQIVSHDADRRVIYGKSSAHGGCVVVKTNSALLVGIYPSVSQGEAYHYNVVVENLGEYLSSQNI